MVIDEFALKAMVGQEDDDILISKVRSRSSCSNSQNDKLFSGGSGKKCSQGSEPEKHRKNEILSIFIELWKFWPGSRNPVTPSGSATVIAALQVAIIDGFIYAHFSILFTSWSVQYLVRVWNFSIKDSESKEM